MKEHADPPVVAALQFTPVTAYTTFRGEFAIDGDDLVFHFFKAPELADLPAERQAAGAKQIEKYWKDSFPRTMDIVARSYFSAEFPALKGAFTQELDSWWLRCFGMANVPDPTGRSESFCKRLDQSLDAVNVNTTLF